MNDVTDNVKAKTVQTKHQPENEETENVRSQEFERALVFFKSQLWEEEGKETLKYLKKKRRYTETDIKGMDLGCFPSPEKAQEHLGSLINILGLTEQEFGTTHRLVIPYRDPVGPLKGFIVRRLNATRPKFIYSAGTIRDTLFNSHLLQGDKHTLVVEGYFDALMATQRGIKGVVAIGGTRLTQKMVEDMIEKGVTTITLIPDNDLRGLQGAEKSLQLISEHGLNASVVELPDTVKDLDEFIRKAGIEAFQALMKQPLSGERWKEKYAKKGRGNIKVQVRTDDNTAHPSRIYYIRREKEN
jgi:DNA primase catalytic core